jgi:hypothetical protein
VLPCHIAAGKKMQRTHILPGDAASGHGTMQA